MTSLTKKQKFFSLQTGRLAESFEGSNSLILRKPLDLDRSSIARGS